MAISPSTFSKLFSLAPKLSISSSSSITLPSTISSLSRHRLFTTSSPPPIKTLSVYEINEGDRRSPSFLKLSKLPEKSLGDIVTFSNKLYSGDLTTRLGITAGMIMYIEKDEGHRCDRYEAVYSFYFGNYGHVSVQGPYFSGVDSELAVTGGTGVFHGARGKVKLVNVVYPFKLFYTFEISDVGDLPEELVGGQAVKPTPA